MRRAVVVMLIIASMCSASALIAEEEPHERSCQFFLVTGPHFALKGVVMNLVAPDDPELLEQRRTCNHYASDALVTPDCTIHYNDDFAGNRMRKLEPPLYDDGTCAYRADGTPRIAVRPGKLE